MAVSGLEFYHYGSYDKADKNARTNRNNTRNLSETISNSQSHFTLHYFDDAEGNTALAAACIGEAGSVTIYKPADYDADNPTYLVKYWDEDGNIQEINIKPKEIDVANASYLELLSYAAYSDEQGITKGAFGRFLSAVNGSNPSSGYGLSEMLDKQDYKQVIKEYMQMQYSANNLSGYLTLKQFYDGILQQESEIREEKAAEEDIKKASDTETEVIVKPDGSRVLLTTIHIGNAQTTMSLELSKPTDLMGNVKDAVHNEDKDMKAAHDAFCQV